jgi:hypothetical protein
MTHVSTLAATVLNCFLSNPGLEVLVESAFDSMTMEGATEAAPAVQDWLFPVTPDTFVPLGRLEAYRVQNLPLAGPIPWLDRPDGFQAIRRAEREGRITASQAALCRQWRDQGYVVLPGFFSAEKLDRAWHAYEQAIADGRVKPQVDRGQENATDGLPGRVLNPHFTIPEIAELWSDRYMLHVVSVLLGAQAEPFQTIAGHKGSEQLSHSDSIHMTTYPIGYLAANWIAFEDIMPDSGPLEFYPGSHRLPYLFSDDVDISLDEVMGSNYAPYHAKYEPAVARLIEENNLKPEYFLARKGDVLLWHANLLHGGARRQNPSRTRRALVCHFFARGCVCFHDYAGTLSSMHPPKVSRADFDGESYLRANPDVLAAGVDPWEHYLNYGFQERRALTP